MSDQPIPKIIHQIWISAPGTVAPESEMKDPNNVLEKLPLKWRHCSAKFKELCEASGWEYRVWTNASAQELIATEFPWFLAQYNGYQYAIQQADAIRYFILSKYGGIYSDLDIRPKANFVALYDLYKDAEVVLASTCSKNSFGSEKYINGFIMSKPNAAFWPVVWKHLQHPDQNTRWYKPLLAKAHYFKILFHTGPGIICDAAAEFDPDRSKIVAIPAQLIQPQRTSRHTDVISAPESVVELVEGESWQQKDANVWRTLGEVANNSQWILLGFVIAFALVIVVLLLKLRQYRKAAAAAAASSPARKAALAYGVRY